MPVAWVALSYRLPREPSRLRLAVWRRLKRLGAVVLHDAIWLLPADAKTREAFEWLAEEIDEQGGTALAWDAQSFAGDQDRHIVGRFREEADARYRALAESARRLQRALARKRAVPPARLKQIGRQTEGLERALRLEWRRDYFRAPGRAAATETVRAVAAEAERRLAAAGSLDQKGRSHAVGD